MINLQVIRTYCTTKNNLTRIITAKGSISAERQKEMPSVLLTGITGFVSNHLNL